VAQVPSTTAKIDVDVSGKKIKEEGVEFIPNPYDEWYSVVRAVELKQQVGGEVIVYSVGPASWEQTIRKCLALGADKGVRIDTNPHDEYTTALLLSEVLKRDNVDIILTGKETIDYQGGMVGSILAGFLDIPFISSVSKLDIKDGKVICERDVPGAVEIVECYPPVVISSAKGMAEQKLPSIMAIMQAKKKPLEVISPSNVQPSYEVISLEMVTTKKECKIFTQEEIDKFIEEVIKEKKIIPV